MNSTLGLLWLFWSWLTFGKRNGAASRPAPGAAPPPPLPTGYGTPAAPVALPTPPPWPAQLPAGLPPFPGPGWEYDEPPPPVVQARAGQLLSQLWADGKGAFRIEQTAGRMIAYQSAIVRSGKKGVVAFRVKRASSAVPKPPVRAAPRAAPPAARPVLTTSPGWPQPAAGDAEQVAVVKGHTYRWTVQVSGPVTAEQIGKGLAAGGAVDVRVSGVESPFEASYVQTATANHRVTIGVPMTMQFAGVTATVAVISGVEVKPVVRPIPMPQNAVMTAAPAPGSARVAVPGGSIDVMSMPTLRQGKGMPPAAPDPDVRVLQTQLAIGADGRFGPGTRKAVVEFQRIHSLDPDGIVGPNTWAALLSASS